MKKKGKNMKEKITIDKFYDFINLYNLIIKHCAKKKRKYEILIYYLDSKLHLIIKDQFTKHSIFDDKIECNCDEAEMIENMITNEFILNHQINLSSFKKMAECDIASYYLSNKDANVSFKKNTYYNENNNPMVIHELVNSIFTLQIYHYNGLNDIIESLHKSALSKLNSYNENKRVIKIKK